MIGSDLSGMDGCPGGIDPTHGAIHFNQRTTGSKSPWTGKHGGPNKKPTMTFGPFDNAVNRNRFIDIYP